MNLPFGWTKDYALEWLYQKHIELTKEAEKLRDEVELLKQQKADRRGRKPGKPLSGDSGPPIA